MIESPFRTRRDVGPVAARPWRLCRDPGRWGHFGVGMGGVEVETLHFLEALVVLCKPEVVAETGTFTGSSTAALARGCARNGSGHVWSLELDGDRAGHAENFLADEGLGGWATVVRADARKYEWGHGPIDMAFFDGGEERRLEIEHLEPWFSERCVVLGHDAAERSHGYDRLPGYGGVLLPTPLGLAVMQRGARRARGSVIREGMGIDPRVWDVYVRVLAAEASASPAAASPPAPAPPGAPRVLLVGPSLNEPGLFPGFRVRAIVPRESDAEALRGIGVEADVGDVHDMPYASASFEAVFASNVLEHSVAPYVALMEIRRVLGEGGEARLVMPTFELREGGRGPFHLHCLDRRVWEELLRKTGLPPAEVALEQASEGAPGEGYLMFRCAAARPPGPHGRVLDEIRAIKG